ncbi:hypothetical protein ACVWWO_007383 [Bradyrhizobium sp. F1.13.1]
MRSSTFQKLAPAVFAAIVVFNVTTYSYYRGSVVTPFHGSPVSPSKHRLSLTDAVLLSNGAVRFHAYLHGGTPATPSNVKPAVLKSNDGKVLEQWDGIRRRQNGKDRGSGSMLPSGRRSGDDSATVVR